MAVNMSSLFLGSIGELRFEPTRKRVRARIGEQTVVDSDAALLVWEPRRVVPVYAVPTGDILTGDPQPSTEPAETEGPDYSRIPVWDPRVPFAVRTTAGRSVEVGPPGHRVAGFIADDPQLDSYVILDFDGFDTWLEEDVEILSHPHSPFSRIDVRNSSVRYQLAIDGQLIVDTTNARILFETGLTPRYYVPREDVLADLEPSAMTSTCAYKGIATYYSPVVNGEAVDGLAWSYENPLIDGEAVKDLLCFFDERMDVTIDGVERARPTTAWS